MVDKDKSGRDNYMSLESGGGGGVCVKVLLI